jgi:DNA topoisomerase-1
MMATATESNPTIELPQEAAAPAGLRYARLDRAGITRERAGEGWRYRAPDGTVIREQRVIDRINGIVIPPAWSEVWISTDPRAHIQATGLDDRGRKQYRYHPKWREARDETKFDHMVAFAEALPGIREQVDADLGLRGFPRDKVIATVVRLLETSLIRVGNETYVKENRSYGLTTLRNRHAKVEGSNIHFAFRGKSGVKHAIDVRDRRLAQIVRRMRDLPGYHLFQYVDDDGELKEVDSADVNDYLHRIAGNSFSAKDFRTWAGTVMCAVILRDFAGWETESEAKRHVVEAIKQVAKSLGNTPAVTRKAYVHPAIIEAFLSGATLDQLLERTSEAIIEQHGTLRPEEEAVLALLRERGNELAIDRKPKSRNGQSKRTSNSH